MNHRRVVITGIGPYISCGKGKEILWDTVIKNSPLMHRIPECFEKNAAFKSKFYVPFPKISFEETGLHSKYKQITDNTSRLAIVCAKLAFEDAGFHITEKEDIPFYNDKLSGASIILGIGICTLKNFYESFVAHILGHDKELLQELQFDSHFNRMVVPMLMPNSATAWISILFGIHGENFTVNTACSSGNYAIGEAYRKIKDRYSDLILTGGIENFEDPTGSIMRSYDSLGTLTRSSDGRPMPFSKQRSGFLFSEGAGCVIVLEEYERAMKRNAPVYAEISGFESNSDAHNIVLMDEKGSGIRKIIEKLSQNRSVDYINAHGTATVLNDEVEANAIRSVFGNRSRQPLINSTKGILGHTIGASASLEAAVTALSIQKDNIHKNASSDNMDDLSIAETTINKKVNTALSLSYGFGGHNSGLLLTKCH